MFVVLFTNQMRLILYQLTSHYKKKCFSRFSTLLSVEEKLKTYKIFCLKKKNEVMFYVVKNT